MSDGPVRVVAFHLPQFYPTPENDEWWEPGFTEWTNVRRAEPLFPGHRQPVVPTDLGYYDFREPEVREAQADLARGAGISAFCFWHYWFGGRRILHEVVDEIVESGQPDFQLMLGWANQSWTGIWHGAPGRMLIEQTYPEGDDERHFAAVLPALRDHRAFTVGGKPAFYVFCPEDLPNPARFVDTWQRLAAAAGLGGLHLIAESKRDRDRGRRWLDAGFDAVVDVRFPPVLVPTTNPLRRTVRRWRGGWLHDNVGPTVYDMGRLSPRLVRRASDERVLPCVLPQWDNTPRSAERGRVFHNASPQLFETQVEQAASLVAGHRPEHRLVFVKSWNEWAETNHLEPDDRAGRGYLDALRRGLAAVNGVGA